MALRPQHRVGECAADDHEVKPTSVVYRHSSHSPKQADLCSVCNRAGLVLHFPVVQRQRVYRLKLIILPGAQGLIVPYW